MCSMCTPVAGILVCLYQPLIMNGCSTFQLQFPYDSIIHIHLVLYCH